MVTRWVPKLVRDDFQSRVRLSLLRKYRQQLKDKSKAARKKQDEQINVIRRAIDEMDGWQLVAAGEFEKAERKLSKAGEVDAI